MKKLFLILLLFATGQAYCQVHQSFIPTTRLSDSVLSNGKHEFTVKPDSTGRWLGHLYVTKSFNVLGNYFWNGAMFNNAVFADTVKLLYRRDTVNYWSITRYDSANFVRKTASATLTNKNIDATQNTITKIGKSYMVIPSGIFSPAPVASTTYYLSGIYTPGTNEAFQKLYFPTACTITAASIAVLKGTAASSQNVSAYLQVNGSDVGTITTTWQWTTANGIDYASVTGLSVSVSANSYLAIKIVTPAWSTAPTIVNIIVNLEILNNN